MADWKRIGLGVATGGMSETPWGKGIAGAVGAAKDAFGGEGPTRQNVGLDAESEALISRQKADAMKSEDEVAGELTQGVDAQGSLINNPVAQNKGMMSGPDDLDSALAERGSRAFQTSTRDLKQNAKMTARDMQNQKLQSVAGKVAQREAIKRQAYDMSLKDKQAKEGQRTSFISSILGTAGMAGGALIGGPGGAQLGATVGQAAGEGLAAGTRRK